MMNKADEYGRIGIDDTALLLIDVQQRFVPHVHGIDELLRNCVILVKGCVELGVPMIITEQYPRGLGATVAHVRGAVGKHFSPLEKEAFSVFDDEKIAAEIKAVGRPNLLVCGIEAHVCVIKSALDGLALGYSVHWVTDAVSSRAEANVKVATQRAIQCGAFSTSSEMALFQLMKSKNDHAFTNISKMIR